MTPARSMLGAYAQLYAERGFAVFPLMPRAKEPRVPGGFKAATRDLEAVSRWWRRWPNSNVGIATGSASGLVVLDIDPRNGGDESLEQLLAEIKGWPDAPTVHTGGGGTHVFFAHPGDGEVPCRKNAGGRGGIDVKGDGGYVVAAPSIHPSGREYVWDAVLGPDDGAIPLAPTWLLELARGGKTIKALEYDATSWDGTIPGAVEYAIAVSGKVFRRFNRDPAELVDTSPSGIDYSLACLLALFTRDGAAIEAGIRASRAKAGLPERPPSYYVATVGKALALAREARR